MNISILKKVNLNSRIGQMMFKIRMANKNQERINDIYKEYGMSDSEGYVIDLIFQFYDIGEQMYQTNQGLPYSEIFPNLIYKEEISELVAVITAPKSIEKMQNNKQIIRGKKVMSRVKNYVQKLKENGVEEKEILFLKEWQQLKDYASKTSYEKIIKEEDILLLEFEVEVDFKGKMFEMHKNVIEKYKINPDHWELESEV